MDTRSLKKEPASDKKTFTMTNSIFSLLFEQLARRTSKPVSGSRHLADSIQLVPDKSLWPSAPLISLFADSEDTQHSPRRFSVCQRAEFCFHHHRSLAFRAASASTKKDGGHPSRG